MKPRKATIALAVAMMLALSALSAHAGPSVVCTEKKNTTVQHNGTDGSECFASSDGKSKGHSTATGDKSFADAEAMTGGKATAIASGVSSFSGATADTRGRSTASATGDGSQANAATDANGKAKSTANGSNAEADTQAFGKCKATSMATGAKSLSTAVCTHSGKFATATATGGGTAMAFDDKPPVCAPAGGTAMVRSSFGNCP
jgi:Family of unknown function (DUF6764)